MIDALRYEIVRLRTIRSTWWITGGAVVIGLAVGLLFGWGSHHDFSRTPPSQDDIDHFGGYVMTQLGAAGVPNLPGFLLAILPPGAFIVLGLLIAGKNRIDQIAAERAKAAAPELPAQSRRVRVTGVIE